MVVIDTGASFTKGLRLSLDLGYVRDLNLSLLSLLSPGLEIDFIKDDLA